MAEKYIKKKKYGQNFLTSAAIPQKIAELSGVDSSFGILEIGAGQGILTEQLASRAGKVVALEIDADLIPYLREKFATWENVVILQGDILEIDIASLLAQHFGTLKTAVCANLPYYITSPILMKLMEGRFGFEFLTVMVQKEVANRLIAPKGTPDYGAMSAVCAYYAAVKRLFNVSAGSFSPPPKVDSSVVKFDFYSEPPVHPINPALFRQVLAGAFAQRRKTFLNSLSSVLGDRYDKESILKALRALGLPENIRGEALDIYDFSAVSDFLINA